MLRSRAPSGAVSFGKRKHGNYRSLIASAAFPGLLAFFPLLLARKILSGSAWSVTN